MVGKFKNTPKTSANLNQAKARVEEIAKAQAEEIRKQQEASKNVRQTPFTLEELNNSWLKFSQKPDIRDNPFISTIVANEYDLDGTTIQLHLSNTLQEDQMHRVIPQLLKHLRNDLKNDLIELKAATRTEQSGDSTSSKNKLYTDADKLKHLTDEYPLFAELKELLGLDLS